MAPDGRSSYRWWLLSSFLTALGLHSNYTPFQKLLWQLARWQNILLCLFTCGQLWLPRWSGENAPRFPAYLAQTARSFYSAENWMLCIQQVMFFLKSQSKVYQPIFTLVCAHGNAVQNVSRTEQRGKKKKDIYELGVDKRKKKLDIIIERGFWQTQQAK